MTDNYYSTNLNEAAEYFAEKYILESARARDAVGIGEFLESEGVEWKSSKVDDFNELREAVYKKIGTAELDIFWSEGR